MTKAGPSRARPRRRPPGPGDDLGAAELGRRVAARLRALRRTRGMSLDQLAEASGVSRAALSQIETCRTNPTVGLLWKVAVGFGVPFAELLGEDPAPVSVLRRDDMQVLRSLDGKLHSRALAPAGAHPFIEVYELRLAARGRHVSEPHAPGVREIVVVLSGALRLTVGATTHALAAGDSVWFAADVPHVYNNPGTSEARYHDLILYAR
jgi:transcriptional regulator with XRE-family HTH domain